MEAATGVVLGTVTQARMIILDYLTGIRLRWAAGGTQASGPGRAPSSSFRVRVQWPVAAYPAVVALSHDCQ